MGVIQFVDCSIFTREALELNWDEMTELARWANFFVIVGSSAGALIGLQFVVITLVATMPHTPGQERRPPSFISDPCCYSRPS